MNKFGTAPVFFTAISTILGAILFLRFGYAVGNVNLLGTIAIILIAHMVTIPTAMAIAEIATNQKVEGGGEYFIISRSFGVVTGSAIGITLYLSQSISVAFYIMAFAESFSSLFEYCISSFVLPDYLEWALLHKQFVGIPTLLLLTYIMLTKGAKFGVKALYVVVTILGISLAAFFLGKPTIEYTHQANITVAIDNANKKEELLEIGDRMSSIQEDPSENAQLIGSDSDHEKEPGNPYIPIGFFTVFAIIFPAFTGMTAGVGLSGDLKNPGRSIPIGTLAGTLSGLIVYMFIAYKLSISATTSELVDTSRMVMADIAWQGWWIIPLGLASATLSSALGSIMVAPRTLQAIARDRIFPVPRANKWLSKGQKDTDEPYRASIVTIIIAGIFISVGAIDSVAKIISMFFMMTYGSLCMISFLNHFAADPSYRPKFKSRWYISIFGAIACFTLMFFMNAVYALIAIVTMASLYFIIVHFNQDRQSMALIFQGVIFQLSRQIHVFLQKAKKEKNQSWRPSAVAISKDSFERLDLFDLLRWISQTYGFGTYIHRIEGYLSRQTNQEAQVNLNRLIKMTETSRSNIYVDTMVSPSFNSTVAQVIQLPGIAGTENNLLLLEFSKLDPKNLDEIIQNFSLIRSVDFDVAILGSSSRGFGLKNNIHIWITSQDYQNANVMILLSYIIIGHQDWHGAEITIYAIFPEKEIAKERTRISNLIDLGQLPISKNNIRLISRNSEKSVNDEIIEKSVDADLTILGFNSDLLKHSGKAVFEGFNKIGNILFVNTVDEKEIK